MTLYNTDCNPLLFVCIILLLRTEIVDLSTVSPCQSPQYAELGEMGVIRCNVQYQYHGFYWYMGNVRLDNNPAIRFEDTRKTGYGYPNEFDCTSDGSLVVKNVTSRHDTVFKILILRSDVEERNVYEVILVTTITPDLKFPMIKRNNNTVSDYVKLNNNDSLACVVIGARPPSRITWFKTVPQDGSELTSAEAVRISNNNVSYDTFQTTTSWSKETFVLETFFCRSVGPKYERIAQIVVDFEENDSLMDTRRAKVITISGNKTVYINCDEHLKPDLLVWKKVLQDRTMISLAVLSKGNVKKLVNDSVEDFDIELDGKLVIYKPTYQERHNMYRCVFKDGFTTSKNSFQLLSGDLQGGLVFTDGGTLDPDEQGTRNVLVVLLFIGIALLIIEKDVRRGESDKNVEECFEENEEQTPLFTTKPQDNGNEERSKLQDEEKICHDYAVDEESPNPHLFQDYAKRCEWKGLITFRDFLEVRRNETQFPIEQSLNKKAFCFLSRVMAYDNQAMTVFATMPNLPTSQVVDENDDWYTAFCEAPDDYVKNENESNLLNLVLTLIIKCDMFLRQKVLERMSACNIAVPVLLPIPDTDELFYLNWGLRSITKLCKDTVSGEMAEEYVLCTSFPTVLFITLGDATESAVSQGDMSNKVLATLQENAQSYFFIGNEQESHLYDGLLECVWLTSIRSVANFDRGSTKPISFLNLRGNALNHTRQLTCVLPTVHLLIAFIQDSQISKYNETFKEIRSNGAHLCIVSNIMEGEETSIQDGDTLNMFNVNEIGQMATVSKVCCILKDLFENDTDLPLRPCLDECFNDINSEKDAVAKCSDAEKVVRRILEQREEKSEIYNVFWEETIKLKTCDYMLRWLEILMHNKYDKESVTKFLIDYFEHCVEEEERRRIATFGARILLSGRPLELVQGDTYRVPTKWIEKVLEETTRLFKTQNTRVFVISAIGVQNSGKSCLLNTVFKTCFPVGSGQRSKGMGFQLLKISESQKKVLKCDFIAVIDTEGIHEPDLKPFQGTEREISLTAFVMLISDLALLNVAGETMENNTANVFVSAAQMVEEITDHKIVTQIIHHLISDARAKQLQAAEINYLRKRLEKRDKNNVTLRNKVVIDEDSYYFPPVWMEGDLSKNNDFCEVGFQLKDSSLKILEQTMDKSDIKEFMTRISVAYDSFIKTM
ncbi:Interferon-induced very large GTPase 1 [Holothuria leucospilota]|uniref:Interferon-induced very large GTPase 1 n=1 Tax=Holothuria leucospilota TaxID=206669 RepID=A0A9Q1H4N5_HOLLE|nr:Interferon-induced very large GTPase 1 [Holothuria leucospilota]